MVEIYSNIFTNRFSYFRTEKQVINKRKSSEKVSFKKKSLNEWPEMFEAPTFYPSEEDFQDPLDYFEVLKPIAEKYGICKVVPPPSFKVCTTIILIV